MQPQDFHRLGIATIPVFFRSKKPSTRWLQYQHKLPTAAEIARWFRPGRQTNAAVVCGWQGLTVLDFDDTPAYSAWLAWAIAESTEARDIALQTYRVRTSRGMHVYTFIDETPRCGHFKYGDIKARGGYVLIPPSVHPSGAIYAAVDEQAPILRVARLEEIAPDAPEPPLPRVEPSQHVFAMSQLWPVTTIEHIKERTPILSMFSTARPTGGQRWFMARCPFHDDQHESLWIDAQNGICGCYSGCTSKPLDVIDVYARLKGLDTKQAIKELAGQCL